MADTRPCPPAPPSASVVGRYHIGSTEVFKFQIVSVETKIGRSASSLGDISTSLVSRDLRILHGGVNRCAPRGGNSGNGAPHGAKTANGRQMRAPFSLPEVGRSSGRENGARWRGSLHQSWGVAALPKLAIILTCFQIRVQNPGAKSGRKISYWNPVRLRGRQPKPVALSGH